MIGRIFLFIPVPEKKKEMIQQYGEKSAEEIIEYSYENSVDPTIEVIPPSMNKQQFIPPKPPLLSQQQQQLYQIQQYNETMKQMNSNARMIPPGINKFSPAYARIMASKPKATSSAHITIWVVFIVKII